MTSFLSGPAEGKVLMLRRSPIFLRVVINADGKVDALDRLEDQPTANEQIHVYKLEGKVGTCHINRRGGGGGFFSVATYRYLPQQPQDSDVREIHNWQAWCLSQPR
jgi:hypothetical protein